MKHKTRFGCLLLFGIVLTITLFTGPAAADSSAPTSISGEDSSDDGYKDTMPTRFGDLSINEDYVLRYKGIPVDPEVKGNPFLGFKKIFTLGNADVVIVGSFGAGWCPAKFYFVTVKSVGVSDITEIGTCSGLIKYKKTGSSITVIMPGYQYRGSKKLKDVKYVYRNGVVTENGKVIEDSEDTPPPKKKHATKDETLKDFSDGDSDSDRYSTKHGELTLVNEEVRLNGKTIVTSAGRKDVWGRKLTLMVDDCFSSPDVPLAYQESKDYKPGKGPVKIDRIIIPEFADINCIAQFILFDFTGDKPFVSERFGYNYNLQYCFSLKRIKWGKKKSYFYLDGPEKYIYYTGSRVEPVD